MSGPPVPSNPDTREPPARSALLAEVLQDLLSAKNSSALVDDLFPRVAASVGAEVYLHFAADEERRELALRACDGIAADALPRLERMAYGQGICGRVAVRRLPMHVTGIQRSTEESTELVRSLGIDAYFCSPLLVGETLLGTLSFARRGQPSFDAEELDYLGTVAQFVAIAMDRIRSEQALRRSESRYRLLHESLRDPFVQVDMEGRIIEFNALYGQMLGYTPEELRALTYVDLTPPRWHGLEAEIVRTQVLPRGYSDVYAKEYIRKDGTLLPVELRTILSRDDAGRPSTMWAIVRDISDRKRAEDELREANQRLEAADRRKDEFLAVLSHELRNPLAPILNAVQVLGRVHAGGERARQLIDIVERQARHLARLVDDLLDVNRISTGKIEVRREPTELGALVAETVRDLRSLFTERGHDLTVESPGGVVWVRGDAARLAQVVGNLLQNAAKFTPGGGRVRVRVEAVDGSARIVVADDGVGIEPDMLERIFDPFAQAALPAAHGRSGLGLGLALVKGIVALHDGTVVAESAGPHRGATFTIKLPLAGPPPAAPSWLPDPSGRGCRVLVIDDSLDAGESTVALLECFGHEASMVGDGVQGIERCRQLEPDVVLCDIGMPGMDGYEVARRIRSDGPAKRPFLIALTGFGMEEDRRRAAEAGFDAHLTKPADPERLRSMLRAVMEGGGAQRERA